MCFWNSLAFLMIQQMMAVWSLVPLPFLKPAWTSESSRFTYCWSLAWRILSIPLLACERVQLCCSLSILWHCHSWDWNENWPFPVLWPLLSFPNLLTYWVQHFHSIISRIWNSSTGILPHPLALFVVMLSKAHLTLHSRMSGSRWVITPLWLSGSWRCFFVQFFCVFLPPLLNIFCFC